MMNKTISLLLLVFITFASVAQQAEITTRLNTQAAQEAFPSVQVLGTQAQQMEKAVPVVPGFEACELVLKHVTESNIGRHYFYEQQHAGIPVYGCYLKISTNHNGRLLSSFHTLIKISDYSIEKTAAAQTGEYWVVYGNSLIKARAQQTGYEFTLKQADGNVLYAQDKRLFYTDTMARALVFNPDPLTTAGVMYGKDGTYRHFNDSDYALLNDQRQLKTFPVRFNNDTFFLANKYCIIKEMEAPVHTPSTSITGQFMFTRGQVGFKEVMAIYHIYAIQQYLQGLGFTNLVNYQLKVDPHASTADQSFFSYSNGDTTLKFGLGGVPDAEDADVIAHEYTHAISFSLNADGITSTDRRAIEEGLCDALSCVYSKKQSTYNWRNIFGWDGHNEFWDGRNGSSTKTYDNKIGDVYSDSEIWSSAMNNLAETIGEDVMIKLLLSAIPQFTPNTTMPQAAHLMYNADSIIYNKTHQGYLALEFNARKFDSFPVGLNDVLLDRNFSIRNTFAFASGTDHASITLKQGGLFDIAIYNLNGSMVFSQTVNNTIGLNPADFKAGIYFLKIRYAGREGYYKLVKY
jgi:hypothetical protein